jgi:hypothetical protein
MRAHHVVALKKMVVDQESLQEAWNHPIAVKLLANREALLCLIVTKDKNGYFWNAAARIHRMDKKTVKKRSLWTSSDLYSVSRILYQLLGVVGDLESEETFSSQWALHIQRKLTSQELSYALDGELLGKVQVEVEVNGDS